MRNSCLASLVAFLLIIFLSVFILTAEVKILTSPNFLIQIIKQSQILNKLDSLVDETVISNRETSQANLNGIVLIKAAIKSLEPAIAEEQLSKLIIAFSDYLHDKTTNLDATINLKDLKTSFSQKWPVLAPEIFREEYDKLPACKQDESPQKMVGETSIINCQSPALSAATLEEEARKVDLNPLLKTIPDEMSLDDWAKNNHQILDRLKLVFNVLNLVFWLSLVLSVLGVASLAALGWPNGRAISGWIGWIFVMVAGPIFSLDLFSQSLLNKLQSLWAGQTSQDVINFLNPILENFNRFTVKATISLPAIIFGLGVVLVVLSFVLPRYEPRVVPPGFGKKTTP